jgi:hypothetical protein
MELTTAEANIAFRPSQISIMVIIVGHSHDASAKISILQTGLNLPLGSEWQATFS